jgi:hypothetical protein
VKLIKISADNERLLRKASTEAELRGAVDLVLERIAQSEALKAFKKEPTAGSKGSPYHWQVVVAGLREALGDDLSVPPFPDSGYVQSVHRYAKMYDVQGERLQALCDKLPSTYLKPPYQAVYLLINYDRIMKGAFDKDTSRYGFKPSPGQLLPRTPLPSLPAE